MGDASMQQPRESTRSTSFAPWVLRPFFRIAVAAAGVLLFAAAYPLPVWQTRFVAPQYPYGLRMEVYLDRVTGDTQEVNILNHYVGMRPVEQMALLERALASIALLTACGFAMASACAAGRRAQFWLAMPFVLFPPVMLADLYGWLYYAGHALDPTSPLSMTVKPFTPRMIGYQRVANFDVWSTLGPGACLMLAGSALVAGGLVVGAWARRRMRRGPDARPLRCESDEVAAA